MLAFYYKLLKPFIQNVTAEKVSKLLNISPEFANLGRLQLTVLFPIDVTTICSNYIFYGEIELDRKQRKGCINLLAYTYISQKQYHNNKYKNLLV